MGVRSPFPAGFLDVELFYGGAWHSIFADLSSEGVTIERGRQDGAGAIDPAKMMLRLKSGAAGKYAPRNPGSPLYGLIGRNTPIRAFVLGGRRRTLTRSLDAYWSTPDGAAVSITGDLDLRADLDPPSWRPSGSAYVGVVKSGAYGLFIREDGTLVMSWSTNGVDLLTVDSFRPVPGGPVGRRAVRATLDVNDGAGGHEVVFYSAPTIAGPWVEFDRFTDTGTTSVNDSTNGLSVFTSGELGECEVHAVEVRSGIGGTAAANPDFSVPAEGATSFTDAAGRAWTRQGTAMVTARRYRFWGEVPAWPMEWGRTGAPSVAAPIVCAGVMRRLGQGDALISSPMRRGCLSIDPENLLGYWPLEDEAGATSMASGIGGKPMRIISAVQVAQFGEFAASQPVPVIGTGRMLAYPRYIPFTGEAQVRWITRIPAGLADNTILMFILLRDADMSRLEVVYDSAGTGGWYLRGYDTSGALVGTTATFAADLNGQRLRLSVELAASGLDTDITMIRQDEASADTTFITDTFGGVSFGRVAAIDINPLRVSMADVAVGHVTVEAAITSIFDLLGQFSGWTGETATARLARLAGEAGASVALLGAGGRSQGLGPQKAGTFLQLAREAADADGGMFYEPRGSDALAYRSLESMCTQQPGIEVAYTDNLLNPFRPVEDDTTARNRVTVTRDGGSAFTAEDATSSMGILPPPAGIGAYEDQVTLSLAGDDDAEGQAWWRVHVGTVDEARWPVIGFNLAHPTFLASPDLTGQILGLDLGDRVLVDDLPSWVPPFPVDQLVQGYTETITPLEHTVEFNCVPALPFRVLVWDEAGRWSGPGTVTAAAATTTATSVTVSVPVGIEWTHDDGDYDLMVGGERVTVTGVTLPVLVSGDRRQTFTVVRSVNGVVKEHGIGEAVDVAEPHYYGRG